MSKVSFKAMAGPIIAISLVAIPSFLGLACPINMETAVMGPSYRDAEHASFDPTWAYAEARSVAPGKVAQARLGQ